MPVIIGFDISTLKDANKGALEPPAPLMQFCSTNRQKCVHPRSPSQKPTTGQGLVPQEGERDDQGLGPRNGASHRMRQWGLCCCRRALLCHHHRCGPECCIFGHAGDCVGECLSSPGPQRESTGPKLATASMTRASFRKHGMQSPRLSNTRIASWLA